MLVESDEHEITFSEISKWDSVDVAKNVFIPSAIVIFAEVEDMTFLKMISF